MKHIRNQFFHPVKIFKKNLNERPGEYKHVLAIILVINSI